MNTVTNASSVRDVVLEVTAVGKCIPRALCLIARGSCVMDGNGCND
jgi:hypothetical protein